MSNSTLYELTGQYLELLDISRDPDVDPEVIKDTFEALDGEIEEKFDNCYRVKLELEGDSEKLDKEIKRLTRMKKTIDNSSERLKKLMESAMIATGKKKFKTDLASYRIQKNPASLKIDADVSIFDIPQEFLKYSDPEIDKAAVKQAIKDGQVFDWAKMEQSESIRIS